MNFDLTLRQIYYHWYYYSSHHFDVEVRFLLANLGIQMEGMTMNVISGLQESYVST